LQVPLTNYFHSDGGRRQNRSKRVDRVINKLRGTHDDETDSDEDYNPTQKRRRIKHTKGNYCRPPPRQPKIAPPPATTALSFKFLRLHFLRATAVPAGTAEIAY